jgi:outer membrane protein OmpA-like peptidoglycan-associated protein
MRKFLFIPFTFFLFAEAFAQSTNISTLLFSNEKKADLFYAKKAYRNALNIYQHIGDKSEASTLIQEKIGDCYLHLHDPESAEPVYEALFRKNDVSEEVKLKYAQTLSMNNKHLDALGVLESIDRKKIDSTYIDKQINFIKSINLFYHDSIAVVLKEAYELNSSHSDFGTSYFKNNVVFASTRDYDLFIKRKSLASETSEEALTHLFSAFHKDEPYGQVNPFKKDQLATYFHDGPIVFYNGQKKAAITRSNFTNQKSVVDAQGSVNLKLFLAEIGSLGDLKNVKPFPFNDDKYSVGHPTFTQTGERIYFAANFAEGFGGSDIYYSDFKEEEWTKPINAGPTINTSGDELYPFLQNDSTLYFSSTGHGGFGGLDIFSIKKIKGKFRRAKNLGSPMNSPRDDFAFMTDSTQRNGFLSSNRLGGKGSDDIYSYHANRSFLQGDTRELINATQIIPGTLILVKNDEGILIDSTRSDDQGRYHLDLPFDEDLVITAKKDGYEILEDIAFSTRGDSFGIDSLTILLWKKELFAKGKIYDNETQTILANATVVLTDLTKHTADTVILGEKGEYNFLVRPNRKYRIDAMKKGYISSGFNLNTHNIFKGELLNDIVLEEIYIDKSITLFDYDKFEIKPEWHKQLNHLLRTLKKYPKATLHIGAHADSRGTNAKNQLLSEKRANAELNYFTQRGIDRRRIEAVGFGEELVLNRCSDGVECPEEEHEKNRRAELKVQIN